jgi:hypothetical protein
LAGFLNSRESGSISLLMPLVDAGQLLVDKVGDAGGDGSRVLIGGDDLLADCADRRGFGFGEETPPAGRLAACRRSDAQPAAAAPLRNCLLGSFFLSKGNLLEEGTYLPQPPYPEELPTPSR